MQKRVLNLKRVLKHIIGLHKVIDSFKTLIMLLNIIKRQLKWMLVTQMIFKQNYYLVKDSKKPKKKPDYKN